MDLSIIIVSWNTVDLLAQCLKSVYTFPPRCDFEVIVFDNDSTDTSVQMVRQQFPQVTLLASEQNLGFAGGNNQAINQSTGRYVLLLNPDTEVKADALDILVDFMDANPQAGASGSMLLNPDETLQPSCYPALTLSREFWRLFHLDVIRPYGRYDMTTWDMNKPREVDVIQGASLLLRGEVLDQIGLLDDTYFMYTEEVDLCYRLQKAGWLLYWVPQSKVIHYGGQSTKQVALKMFICLYESKLMFMRKHYGKLAAFVYKFILTSSTIARLLLSPFALFERPPQRKEHLALAGHYRQLLWSIPKM